MARLKPSEIKRELFRVPQWRRRNAAISRVYEFKDFVAALKFVNRIARIAEKSWHHPDIDIRWNRVTVALTTHDEEGLTTKDFELAARFDVAAR